MNARQAAMFRQVWETTGCMAAAARAAKLSLPAAKALRIKAGLGGPEKGSASGLVPALPQSELDRAVEALESEAVRRALSGVQVPVFHQGRECGNTIKHSDQLLMFLLKTLRPERYAGAREVPPPASVRSVVLDIDLSSAGEGAEEGEG